MAAWLKRLGAILGTGVKAFFGIKKTDTGLDVGQKVAEPVLYRSLYTFLDYGLIPVALGYMVYMDKVADYEWFGLFMAMWAFDILVAALLIAFWVRTGIDITLAQNIRQAMNAVYSHSRVAGVIIFIFAMIKAAVWDGPEAVIVFFKQELRTDLQQAGVLLVLSALQAAVWAPIYVLGFDSISDLFRFVFGLVSNMF